MLAKDKKQRTVEEQQKTTPSDKANLFIDAEIASKLDAFFKEIGWEDLKKKEAFENVLEALGSKIMNELERFEENIVAQKNETPASTIPALRPHKATRFAKQFFFRVR